MAPHSSTLAWKIPWTEEPGRLQSMGSLRVGHDWATWLSLFTFMHWRRKWQPTPVFLPGESRDGGAWWAAVYGVEQGRTQLKWLSSSSSRVSKRKDSIMWLFYSEILVQGQQLIEFYEEYALVIANILFQQHKRRLYTLDITRWST